MFDPDYFSSSYFSPLYFAPRAELDEGSAPSGPGGYRDWNAFLAILDALKGSGEFGSVEFGLSVDSVSLTPDSLPAVVIIPTGWTEENDVDPIVNVRNVTYNAVLVVRDDCPLRRYRIVDRLTSVVQNTLDGSDLGGCLPGLTKLRKGRPDLGVYPPEQREILSGEFTYLIETQAGHDVTA